MTDIPRPRSRVILDCIYYAVAIFFFLQLFTYFWTSEGGPTLLGEIVAAGLLDELCLTISPVMGGDPLPVATVPPGAALVDFRLVHVARSHDVLFLRYERATDGP